MIYSYKELEDKYGSAYRVKRAIDKKEIFKVDIGIYSEKENVNWIAIIDKKYPDAIFTLDSAFYYYDLTDVIPERTYLATKRGGTRINNKDIKQIHVSEHLFELGKTKIEMYNTTINIYDKERMLIELVRNKKSLPYDYYKEIIINYRKQSNNLNTRKLQEYMNNFPTENHIYDTIMNEVF